MHVNSKRIAVLGLLLAVDVILIIFGGTLEMSTLFFLAGAAFCVGIAVREYGSMMGAVFFAASLILALILAPVKMYCITYAVMSLYILLSEIAWNLLCRKAGTDFTQNVRIHRIFWVLRYLIFNIMYLPLLVLAPKLIYSGEISPHVLVGAAIAGQVALFLFEKGYCYFQGTVWNRFRRNLR